MRASIFEAEELPSPEDVRAVAQGTAFTSREGRRKPQLYRTGRTASFSVKLMPETVDLIYETATEQGWKVGETLEKAMEVLRERIKGQGR